MKSAAIILSAAFVLAAASASAGKRDEVVPFATQARVEIDAAGKVVQVVPDASLPAAFGDAVRNTVATWTFVPPTQDGIAVGGVTYVRLGACAADVDGAVRLALRFQGTGPGRDLRPPQYPMDELRAGRSASVEAAFQVGTDGRAAVEDIRVDGARSERSATAFRAAIAKWIEDARFEPELVAGKPVPTRLRYPVTFAVMGSRVPKAVAGQAARMKEQHLNSQSETCQAALGKAESQERAVALDSPFRLLSSG